MVQYSNYISIYPLFPPIKFPTSYNDTWVADYFVNTCSERFRLRVMCSACVSACSDIDFISCTVCCCIVPYSATDVNFDGCWILKYLTDKFWRMAMHLSLCTYHFKSNGKLDGFNFNWQVETVRYTVCATCVCMHTSSHS